MAANTVIADPVITRYRKALDEIYGDRLERVVLYGSRARGDARPDSITMSPCSCTAWMISVRSCIGWPVWKPPSIDETGEVVHAMPYRAGSYNERTPLMREIRREGIEL